MQLRFERIVLLLAIVWYCFTAYFSDGYHHPDEHYQIIEFAGLLDGKNSPDELAWEFKAQIRPSIQPVICFGILKTCDFLGMDNPYSKAFVLRLLSGLLACLTIYFFTKSLRESIAEKYWKPFVVLSYFLWFLPFINVRFSSETWSGIMLLMAASIIFSNDNDRKQALAIGALFGLSFLFRYQIAFAVVGIMAWLLLVKKESWSRMGLISAAGLAVVLLGFLLDSWFYGNFVFTPWNYFKVNLIEGVASSFGTGPWYDYFIYTAYGALVPIGILIIITTLIVTVIKPKEAVVWTVLPFFILHSLIAHKETRFLFPVANFVPLLLILFVQSVKWENFSLLWKRTIAVPLLLLVCLNCGGLFISAILPAGVGRTRIAQVVDTPTTASKFFFMNFGNPFTPWGLPTKFYPQKNVECLYIDSIEKYNKSAFEKEKRNLLGITIGELKRPEIQKYIHDNNLKKLYQSTPEFALPFINYFGLNTDEVLVVYSTEQEYN